MNRLCLGLFLFSISTGLFSQELILSKNRLECFYDSTPSGRDSVVIYNSGSDSLVIDSLYSRDGHGYPIDIYHRNSVFGYFIYNATRPLHLLIEPADSAIFVFSWVDICPICKNTAIMVPDDQIIIHSNSLSNAYSTISVHLSGQNSIKDGNSSVEGSVLFQNYPNPFNPSTTIMVSTGSVFEVSLTIVNVLGRQIAVLFTGHLEAGSHKFLWKTDKLPSGIYYCRITTGTFSKSLKLVLQK